MMLDFIKDYGHELITSLFEVKATASAAVSAAGVVTVAVVNPAPVSLGLDEWSTIAVIFSCSATGVYMLSNFVWNIIKIKRDLKRRHDDG